MGVRGVKCGISHTVEIMVVGYSLISGFPKSVSNGCRGSLSLGLPQTCGQWLWAIIIII